MAVRKIMTAAMLLTGIAAVTGSAFATPMPGVDGTISMTGNTSTYDANTINFTNPAGIGVVTGSFTELGTCFTCAMMAPTFSTGSSLALPGFTLFTASGAGGNNLVFDVTSDNFAYDAGSQTLTITGMGTVSLTNFADTTAYFSLTTQGGGPTTFSMKTSVPEPGTLALFGAGLLGCALFVGRRRSMKTDA